MFGKLFSKFKREQHSKKFYTLDEAMDIVDIFEEVLDKYDITVPSPEDDERSEDNTARLYGSVYWDLLERVEGELIYSINNANDSDIITGKFRYEEGAIVE